MALIKPNYRCSQRVLYQIGRMGWNNCNDKLPRFVGYKPKYISTLVAAMLAKIDAAELIPDEETRQGNPDVLHITLGEKATLLTSDFLFLKGYINDSFTPATHHDYYNEAGQAWYEKATHSDGDDVKKLGIELINFITNHNTELTTNLNGDPNMPSGFAALVGGHVTDFQTALNNFTSAEQTTVAQQIKIAANNAIYTDFRNLSLDASFIAHNDHDTAFGRLFIFKVLQRMVDPKTAGTRGTVLSQVSNIFEAGVTLTFQKTGFPPIVVTTGANGHYESLQMEEGEYSVKVEKAGLTTINSHITLHAGVVSTFNFQMGAAP